VRRSDAALEGDQDRASSEEEVDTGSCPSGDLTQELRGLGQHRFRADHGPFPFVEAQHAGQVKLLAAIQ
jgi:hypothetical protein